ncbi:acyl-CoA thioesterase [Croceicoccus ponticola]|uniref:acyl-CoA thioesterase n=1 Tax=Croceicoccus ponticola TaxID=2217664 RepID=UPI001F0CC748|nr:acyl-CoA thioesterase domain-containing protein [Croceicoccus ponticola]
MTDSNPFPDDPLVERQGLFAFEETGSDRFRVAPVPSGLLRQYGGAITAQCFAAACETVGPEKQAHSLHAYFAKPGLIDRPNEFAVSRETDGRSFATRSVRLTQDGAPLMNCMVSFKTPEDSASHALPMPDVPAPETLKPLARIVEEMKPDLPVRHHPFWTRRQQIDWRPVEPFRFFGGEPMAPHRHFWFRFEGPVEPGLRVQQRLLVYASDLHIFHTGIGPLGQGWADDYMQTSSLDHAVWFHDEFQVDEWLLYALDSPAAGNALALGRGHVFRRDGALVATVSQQGLSRVLTEKREGKL